MCLFCQLIDLSQVYHLCLALVLFLKFLEVSCDDLFLKLSLVRGLLTLYSILFSHIRILQVSHLQVDHFLIKSRASQQRENQIEEVLDGVS